MVGADVAMMASAVLRDGPGKVADINAEMVAWLEENEYSSVTQLRGSASQGTVEDPGTFERAQYIRTLHSWAAPANLTPDRVTLHTRTSRTSARHRAGRSSRCGGQGGLGLVIAVGWHHD